MKFHDLEDQVKKLKEEIDNLGDANDIIDETFGEDDGLKLFLGEAFVAVDEDAARNYVDKVNDEKQEELEKKQEEMEETENQMRDLKSYLYAKFGGSINLDEEKWALKQREREDWYGLNIESEIMDWLIYAWTPLNLN